MLRAHTRTVKEATDIAPAIEQMAIGLTNVQVAVLGRGYEFIVTITGETVTIPVKPTEPDPAGNYKTKPRKEFRA